MKSLIKSQKWPMSIVVTFILILVLGTNVTSYADIDLTGDQIIVHVPPPPVPVSERTPQVRDAIVAAVPDVNNANDVTELHLRRIRSLDLYDKSITSLKLSDFAGLTGLRELDLSHNDLTSLPSTLFYDLTNLRTLELGWNSLTTLSWVIFSKNTRLTELSLRVNDLTTLPSGIFDNLTALRTLELDFNDLTTLPSGIFTNLTALNTLWLRANTLPSDIFDNLIVDKLSLSIDTMPADLFDNITVDTLSLGTGTLPSDIFDNLIVESLSLRTNSLPSGIFDNLIVDSLSLDVKTLPSDIFDNLIVDSLSLDVDGGTLPSDIFDNLTALRTLDLSGDNLTSLPTGIFDNLTALRTLDLSGGNLTSLPSGIFDNLTILRTLDLSGGNLTSLPSNIFDNNNGLRTLNLSENFISDVSELENLTSLTSLSLSTNPISDYGPLRRLKAANPRVSIDIDINNNLPVFSEGNSTTRSVPENSQLLAYFGTAISATDADGDQLFYFLRGTDAGTFYINRDTGQLRTGNFLDYETKAIYHVTVFVTDGNGGDRIDVTINVTDEVLDDRTPQVRDAIVAAAGVNSASEVTAAHLAAITTLRLDEKRITALKTSDFDGLTALTILDLSDNYLSRLPEGIFDELVSLTSLYLDNNNLTTLSTDIFSKLTTLTELRLNNNTLTELSENIFSGLTALKQLWLGYNTLTKLPENIFGGLTALTELSLSNNGFTTLPEDVFDGLTALGYLDLHNTTLTSLPKGIFDQLTLTDIILSNNGFTTLPENIFAGLTKLRLLWLQGNAVDPLPLTVSLEKIGTDQFKAVVPTGAPFDITLPITVTNGSISGSATSITIAKGSTESGTLTVTRTPGSTAAITVNIGTLPGIPSGGNHIGYKLVKSITGLPLTLTPGVTNNAPVFTDGTSTTRSVAENTASGQNIGTAIAATDADSGDTLTWTLGGTDAAAFDIDATNGQLKTSAALDYETKSSYSVTVSVSDGKGGNGTISVTINVTDVDETPIIPVRDRTPKVRDAIVAAVPGVNDANDVTATHLAAITSLNLRNAGIAALKTEDFSGLTGLTTLNLFNNQLSSLPDGIFAGLTSLKTIRLGRNVVDPLPLTVSLEKVGTNQFKAVAPAGATFDIVLPITVTSGSISGGATTLTIPHGSVESGLLTVTRTPGTTAVVTVDIGTLPSLPRGHYGYALVKSDSLPITIISGINTAPVFTDGANTTRSVAENSAAGTHIGTAIAATDTENDTLTYTLSGTDASAFDIDSSTGQLKTKAALDYETKTSYTVTLTVSDGPLIDTITVTINVTDIDEVVTPPITPDPPTANSAPDFYEGDSTTRVIAENTPAGVDIGNAVLATDANNDFLGYTLGGTDADAFDMDSSGQLKTKAPLDYETKRIYSVTITVEDDELSGTITVIISVIDVNDTVLSAGFVPVADRTAAVRDAIVAAVPNVAAAAAVTESQVAAITNLNLRNKGIASLKTGDFSGMTSLSNLNLFSNQLSSLPPGIFEGLTALSTLRLSRNAVDPMPIIVTLQQTGNNTFKAVIPTGAPFNIELPLTVTGGSISGGATSVKIPQGTMESPAFTLIGTAAEVSFGTLPGVPRNHFGYKLAQSTVCNRTAEVAAAIAKAVGVSDCSGVTELDLATITSLDLSRQSIASLAAGDFDGMLSLTSLFLSNNDIESLPSGIFDDLVSLSRLHLNSNKLTTVPGGIFSNLTSLTHLYMQSNDLSALPSDAFDGLSALSSINLQSNDLTSLPGDVFDGTPYLSSILLSNNKMTSIPNGIFEGLTQLNQLHLSWNPNPSSQLSLTVSLQKVGTNQLKAVAPSGAPFAIVVPISVKNGTLAGGATALRIPIGTVESLPITVTRTTGTTDAVTANIGTLPNRPTLHNGYALAKGTGLPLEVLPPVNSPPIFTDGVTTTRAVSENTVANANIGTAIAATDINKDKLTYTLGGTDAAAFTVDSATGQLKTKVALDYETKSSYAVTLTVSDGKLNDTITVTINVSNVNEAPTFTDGSSVTRAIAENTSAGANIGAVITATDPDNDTLTYSLGGTDASAFALDITTGQLKTRTALDYETKSLYTLVLTASDGKLTDTIAVTINVTDVQERAEQQVVEVETPTNNAPVFTEGSTATRTVLEGTSSGVDIGAAVSATDADGHSLTYTLGGTDAAAFSMDTTNGQLRTNAALDFETKSSYTVTITASDGTDTATIDVTINVSNATENSAPVFPVFIAGASVSRSVAENTGAGVDIGTPVAATDVDGDTLTYTLGGTDAAAFSIASTSGQLRTSAALDYETKTSYSVTVTVSDGNGGTDSINVLISVTDVDEAPSNRAPVFSEGSRTSRSVLENTGSGVDIGSAVSATDADGDPLSYSLGGADASAFSIDSSTGQLSTNSSLDYETQNSYSVFVNVSDSQGSSASITVTINITNVSETPVFSEGTSTTRSISENSGAGTNIGSVVSAADPDNDTLTYTLGGTDAASFDIDSTSGQLRTKSVLDYEVKSTYTVTVTVSDGTFTRTITVTINVTDINEAVQNRAPVFTAGTSTTRSIAENTATATNIGTVVSATDADGNTLIYTLGGTDAASFSIVSTSGQLQTKAALDYETKTSYSVTVSVSDGNGGSDSITVTINVTDITEIVISPPLSERTSTVRWAIVNAVSGVSNPDDVTPTHLAAITSLSIRGESLGAQKLKAGDFNGLTGLTSLRFYNQSSLPAGIFDDLTALTTLNLSNPNTDFFSSLSSLPAGIFDNNTALTKLYLSQNNISDISALENLTALTTLWVTSNSVSDISPLEDLTSLTDLSVGGSVSDISALEKLTSLTKLSVGGSVRDISVLENLTSLTSLSVGGSVSDISPLENLTLLTHLSVGGSVSDISALENLTSLKSLWLSGNSISDISVLEDLTSLTTLSLSRNSITDVSALEELTSLQSLYLSGNSISDYRPLRRLKAAIDAIEDHPGLRIDINIDNRAPAFSEGASTTRSVAENTGSGVDIGSAVSATDPDTGDTLTYTLGGTDTASFSINSTNGQLRTKAALDYETKTSYSVTITVSDSNLTDSITVTINVTDVQENRAPAFSEGSSATRSVAENTASGVNIGNTVSATDPDTGDTLTYTLGGTDSASFSINSTNGQLRTSAALNYESKTSYSVKITVSDSKLTDSITVTINVTNVNEAPAFKHSTLTRSVAENTAAGTNLGNALDVSDPEGDSLSYTLGGTDAASFSFDSTNRRLQTKAALNYETKTSYTVVVTASDSNGGSDSITVTISVTNVNEAPTFTDGTSTTRSVAENTASGQNIGSVVAATDVDSGTTLTYTLGGTDASSFSIVSTSGQLQTNAALDYETDTSYSVTITVSDGSLTDTISVTINVTDVNENSAPVFTDGTSTTRSVAENTASGQNVGSVVAATDADNDTLTYTLGGTDASSFSIVSTSGQLQTSAALDYETDTSYSVTITVSDNNGGSDSIDVTINVTDVDETPANNAPVFTDGTSTTRSIVENTASGQNIGTAVAATDSDTGDTLTYTLGGTDASSFSIVSTSGQLQTNAALDYETDSSYSVTVSVSDGNGGSDSITVTINVTDVTETPITPVNERTQQVQTAIVAAIEGIDSADDVTATHLATITSLSLYEKRTPSLKSGDFDGLTNLTTLNLGYTWLNSLPSGIFDELTNLTTLYLGETYISSLPSGIFDELTKLTNLVLDCPLSSLPSGVFDELTKLTNLVLQIEYLSSLPSGIFDELTNLTGLRLKGNVHREAGPNSLPSGIFDELTKLTALVINFTSLSSLPSGVFDELTKLTRLDLYYNDLTSLPSDIFDELTALTYLRLGDNPISDYSPLRKLREANSDVEITISTTRSIAENTASGQNIGTPVSSVTYQTTGNTLTYSLYPSTDFSIVRTSGQLQTKAVLDYETKTSYSVIVSVSDGNRIGESITVTINVTDVNEDGTNNAPVFTDGTSTTRSVAEGTAASQNIGTAVGATDTDTSDTLTYSLGGTDVASFSIVSTSGQLQTKAALDYETKKSYSVTVSVSDGNNGSVSIDVTINVTDVDEAGNDPPTFTEGSSTTRSIAENTAAGQNIGDAVAATDSDSSDTLTYSLATTDLTSFSIVSTSGQLQTKAALDYETTQSYTVTVSVSDNNGGSDSITVTINVTDVQNEGGTGTTTYNVGDTIPNFPSSGTFSFGNTLNAGGTVYTCTTAGLCTITNGEVTAGTITAPADSSAPSTQASPKQTALLPNFPNPFNPETWIPYHLAKPSEVTITIYDVRGRVMRVLVLGHQAAGMYRSRSTAAHWDGRNHFGEKVATGVYFYTLKAGDFSATRKMLIRK